MDVCVCVCNVDGLETRESTFSERRTGRSESMKLLVSGPCLQASRWIQLSAFFFGKVVCFARSRAISLSYFL